MINIVQRGIAYTRGIYYGWPMLFAVALAQITSWGILVYAFTIFLDPMHTELGWSMGALTGAYSLALMISGLAAIPVGRWLDRHGPRALMTIGSISATILVAGWAFVDSLIGYYLIWIGIGFVMSAVLYEPAFVIVAAWFERLRSRALTMLTFVAGFASVIYIPLAGWLVATYDWRNALIILAVLLGLGTIPIHAFLLRRSPADIGLAPDGESAEAIESRATTSTIRRPAITLRMALRQHVFWWVTIAFVLASFSTLAIFVHLVPYLTQQGFSPGFAASMAGLAGALALPGRLVFTPIGERIDRRYVTALIFGTQALGLAVLLIAESRIGIFVFVVLFGIGFGAVTPARAAIVADLYGSMNYGAINGALASGIIFTRALAPVLAGVVYTLAGSYIPVFVGLFLATVIAVFAILRARPAPNDQR